ncbi:MULTISPECIES: hypothetical protein [Peribacillus]|uniref:hypothetical protein n=1 Tax=Peribacillus TaxID=2675229 RepID=UPI001F4E00A4|nr:MULTISPECIES: hypothetical protein [unclassified Peribacillus]MCK1985153.1 hypothetical protein [Peribacillus sp. Aquil_B1]MCK2007197.1 hypothetical protein [Peribacillus sp. Aquil_B8]
MEAKVQVIEGVYPVTLGEAVYISPTKTLKQAIDDGSIGGGGSVTTNANFVTNSFVLCGDILFKPDGNKSVTITLNADLSLNRIMVVTFSNGTVRQETIPSPFVLQDKEYMVWNATNGFQIKSQLGGIKVPFDSVLVAMNWDGKITGGIVFSIYQRRYPLYEKEYSLRFNEKSIGSGKTYHSMFVCDDELITLEVPSLGASNVFSLPDLTPVKSFNVSLVETNADLTTSELRLVASDYNQNVRALIMGNSTNSLSEEYMKGYIFYEADKWKNSTNTVTFDNCGLYTKLDFLSALFPGQTTAKMCWAAEDDMAYLTTTNLQYVHKLLLGVGTNKLENGVYDYNASKRYNGTYKIVKTYTQDVVKFGNKDLQFYNGALWYPIKYTAGGYKICKTYLSSESGQIKSDLIIYNPIGQDGNPLLTGSPEGIMIYKGKVYCGHATYPQIYSFDVI